MISLDTAELNPFKATRDSFGEELHRLGAIHPKIVVLDADLSVSTKSVLFAKAFPDRFFQMGIAEANMVSTASGLASTGLVPFICSFGCFLAGRYETIRISIGYARANVKIIGTHAGLGIGEDGYSQMGLEDLNVLRALPGMILIQPSDDVTTRAAVRFAAEHVGPVYLRLTRQKLPALYSDQSIFQMGRGIIIREGEDIALIGTGSTVAEIIKASTLLKPRNPWIIDMPTIKPIDRALVKGLAHTCRWIVTVEDHQITGGLGSAVCEVLAEEKGRARVLRIGVQDTYGESGSPEALYEKYGLSAIRICQKVKELN